MFRCISDPKVLKFAVARIAVAPVDEAAEEERSLLLQEDSLLPC